MVFSDLFCLSSIFYLLSSHNFGIYTGITLAYYWYAVGMPLACVFSLQNITIFLYFLLKIMLYYAKNIPLVADNADVVNEIPLWQQDLFTEVLWLAIATRRTSATCLQI